MPTESSELTKWIKSRVENVNKPAFALAVQRAEVSPDDETQKKSEHRRPASDPNADITTRVLDRQTVKIQADKTVQQAHQAEKKNKDHK